MIPPKPIRAIEISPQARAAMPKGWFEAKRRVLFAMLECLFERSDRGDVAVVTRAEIAEDVWGPALGFEPGASLPKGHFRTLNVRRRLRELEALGAIVTTRPNASGPSQYKITDVGRALLGSSAASEGDAA